MRHERLKGNICYRNMKCHIHHMKCILRITCMAGITGLISTGLSSCGPGTSTSLWLGGVNPIYAPAPPPNPGPFTGPGFGVPPRPVPGGPLPSPNPGFGNPNPGGGFGPGAPNGPMMPGGPGSPGGIGGPGAGSPGRPGGF